MLPALPREPVLRGYDRRAHDAILVTDHPTDESAVLERLDPQPAQLVVDRSGEAIFEKIAYDRLGALLVLGRLSHHGLQPVLTYESTTRVGVPTPIESYPTSTHADAPGFGRENPYPS